MTAQNTTKKDQDGHETHTTALVLMVLATLVVCSIAFFSASGGIAQEPQAAKIDAVEGQKLAILSPLSAEALANTHAMDTLSGLPAGIPVGEEAEILANYETNMAADHTMRVIRFNTTAMTDEIRQSYKQWLAEHTFTVKKEKAGRYAASLAATSGNDSIIVLISYLDKSGMSQVEVINHTRS